METKARRIKIRGKANILRKTNRRARNKKSPAISSRSTDTKAGHISPQFSTETFIRVLR